MIFRKDSKAQPCANDASDFYDGRKLLFLSFAACCIAACYAILRPLKASIFFQLVGKEYYPLTKFFMAIFAVPSVALYSKLVDRKKKHTILYILFSLYFLVCIFFAIALSHPTFGLSNNTTSPYRILGWLFTITIDFYPTFVIGTFWAFINSVSTNTFARKGYGSIHAFIKAGSLMSTMTCVYLSYSSQDNMHLVPLMIAVAGTLTLLSLTFISKLIKTVPEKNLGGYNAEIKARQEKKTAKKSVLGMFAGIKFMVTNPYVLSIFLIFYCYDVIFTIVEYQTHVLISIKTANKVNQMNFFLFLCAAIAEFTGLLLALFVPSRILKRLKLKFALMIMPTFSAITILALLIFPSLVTMMAAMTLLPAVHYSLNSPMREMLFIPTIKEIQFKSKAWMDSFGRTLSKSSAATVNMLFTPQTSIFFMFNTSFSLILTVFWGIIAYFSGKKYAKTIAKKEVIGKV